ncbi:MAG: hypothetical protein RI571_11925 [Roseovarius sp.]|nr:hypothetical protein [Roseovarius sp.]
MFRAVVLLILMTVQAQAGPWPRDKGETFLSFSVEAEQPDAFGYINHFMTLYGEHGLTDRLTGGIDIGGRSTGLSKAVVFLRYPVTPPEHRLKIAAEIGLGRAAGHRALRPAISVGRGFKLGERHGWMAVDTRVVLFDRASRRLVQSDVTVGFNTSSRSKAILQLQMGFPDTTPSYMKLAPSLVLEPRPGRHIEIGVTAGVKELSSVALKLGLWRRF